MSMKFRLVGYASTRKLGRVRIYVSADRTPSPTSEILVQTMPGRFDLNGDPLLLHRAPHPLTVRVRAHLLARPLSGRVAEMPFQPVAY